MNADEVSSSALVQRMVDAVEHVRRRLLRSCAVLRDAGVDYAVIGGNAVAAWVATIDQGAVRNTRDVDILVRRRDFPAVKAALELAGFVHRRVSGIDMFLDNRAATARDSIHIVFAGEFLRPSEPEPAPDVSESHDLGPFRVASIEAIVRAKLTAFRDKDRVHLRDMLGVGLIDQTWTLRFSPVLSARLQQIIDTPDG
ncbi:MAG: hypothetical protein AB7G11_07070 [Phycisphaerales bacterium]